MGDLIEKLWKEMAATGFAPWQLFLLGAGLVLAMAHDLRRRRVPNAVCLMVAASGLVAHAANLDWRAALSGLAAGVVIIAALWQAWARGGIGGGDVKLAGACAVWLGLERLPGFVLSGALVGGLVSLGAYLSSSRSAKRSIRLNLTEAAAFRTLPTPDTAPGRVSVPYAIAVSAGALVALLWGPLW